MLSRIIKFEPLFFLSLSITRSFLGNCSLDMKEYSVSCKRHSKHNTKRQHHVVSKQPYARNHSLILSTSQNIPPPMLSAFVSFLLLLTSITPSHSHSTHRIMTNQTFKAGEEFLKLSRIRTHLKKINKPPVKTIQACIFLFSIYDISVKLLSAYFYKLALSFCCRVQMVI